MKIAYIIFLICCAVNGAMLAHNNVNILSWEYWVCTLIPIVAWVCGRAHGWNF